jgi:DNA-binding IclR family transcriptional regulator
MLAFSSDDVRSSVGSAKLVAKTSRSITDPAALDAELLRIARDRTAVDREELVAGVVCVAAPVFRDGAVIAAVSVTGPKARIDPHRIAAAVQTAARGISRRLSRPAERVVARSDRPARNSNC